MSRQTARHHKIAVRHAPAARTHPQGKPMHRRNLVPKMTPAPAIVVVGFRPTVIDVVEDYLSDSDEALADNVLVTGFEDEDL
jgi:hypothetical protein